MDGVFMENTELKKPIREMMTWKDLEAKIKNERELGNEVLFAKGINTKGLEAVDVLSIEMTRDSPLKILSLTKINNENDYCKILFGD